jgi:hypothetical protein
MLIVIMLSVIMLSVIMLNVIMLSVHSVQATDGNVIKNSLTLWKNNLECLLLASKATV